MLVPARTRVVNYYFQERSTVLDFHSYSLMIRVSDSTDEIALYDDKVLAFINTMKTILAKNGRQFKTFYVLRPLLVYFITEVILKV